MLSRHVFSALRRRHTGCQQRLEFRFVSYTASGHENHENRERLKKQRQHQQRHRHQEQSRQRRYLSSDVAQRGPSAVASKDGVVGRPIDFDVNSKVEGSESQIVTVSLEPGQVLRAESGAMMYMTDGVQMNTTTG